MQRISQVGERQSQRRNTDASFLRYHFIRPTDPMSIIFPGHSPPTSKTIKVDTAAGQPIDNEQYFDISAFEISQFPAYERWQDGRITRSGPTAKYNCHGMTFASRRTGIYETSEIQKILYDDQYREVKPEDAMPGDVIIYFGDDGDAEHSGIVLSSPLDSQLRIPQVLSKWGKFSEFIHWANQSPYNFASVKYFRIIQSNGISSSARSH